MKHLCDYYNDQISELLEKTGSFFAFGQKQFDEQKKEDVTYVNMQGFGGLICPKDKAEEFYKEYVRIINAAQRQDEEENGRRGIIARELANHEAYYVYSIEDTMRKLRGYWPEISEQEVWAVFHEEKPAWDECNA